MIWPKGFLGAWLGLLLLVAIVAAWIAGLLVALLLIPALTTQPWTGVLAGIYLILYFTGTLALAITAVES